MARHDFMCGDCGYLWRDVAIPISLGAQAGAPDCPRCEVSVRMAWIPAMRISLFSDSPSQSTAGNFSKFTLPVEDPGSPTGYRDVTVASLADIRQLERESEQAERNGEGRKMVWRDYSQDHSNQQVHTLGTDPSLTPAKTYTNGEPVRVRRGDPVIADHGEVPE